jgi:O-methyltransferase involved in polyketide biosynthesis
MALHSSTTTSNKSREPSPDAKIAHTMPKEDIRLTGAEEMLLPVVFLKAEDAKSDEPILGDPFSQQLLDRCAIDYSKTHFTRDYRYIKWVTSRAKQFDDWCQV